MKYVNQQGLWIKRVWNLRGGQSFIVCLSRQQMKTFIRILVWWRGRDSHLRTSSSRWREKGRGFIKLLLYLSQEKSKQEGRENEDKRENGGRKRHISSLHSSSDRRQAGVREGRAPQCWGCYVCVLVIGSAELRGFKGSLCIVMKWLLFLFH